MKLIDPMAAPEPPTPRQQARKAINDALPAIIAGLIEQAAAGCAKSAKILLDKGIGNLKPVEEPHEPIFLNTDKPTFEVMHDVLQLRLSGTITSEFADQITRMLTAMNTADKQQDLINDLEALITQFNQGRMK